MAQAAGRVARWLADQVFKTVLNLGDTAAQPDDEGEVYLQCGKLVFDNVPPNLRTELWLSQLHRGSGTGAAAAAQFSSILAEGNLNPDVVAEIDKDTHRTFPGHPRLSKPEGQRAMLDVLCAYAILDPEIGYTQGMNFLAGLLLAFLPREADAFGALVLLMQERRLRELYKPDMSLLQVRLWQLGKLLPERLAAHLESHMVLPVLYASSWFLTCFASDFPVSFAARVLDVVITDCYAAAMMKVAVGILEQCSQLLLEMEDMEMILQHLKQDVPKWPKPVLQDLLTHALSKPWTCQQLETLDQMNGAETVVEAVARVNQLTRSRSASRAESREEEIELSSAASTADAAAVRAAGGDSFRRMVTTRTLSQFSTAPTLGAMSLVGPSFTTAAQTWQQAAAPDSPHEVAPPSSEQQQQQQAAPYSPPLELLRLPPPPGSPGSGIAWQDWGLQTSALDAVPAEQLHIERDMKDVDIAPSLTQALSSFVPLELSGLAPAAGPAAPAAEGPRGGQPAAEAQQAPQRMPAAAAAAPCPATLDSSDSIASLRLWNLHSLTASSSLPSPFDSCPSGRSLSVSSMGRGAPASPRPGSTGTSNASLDDFGSFQRASTLGSAAQQQQQQQQQQAPAAPGPALLVQGLPGCAAANAEAHAAGAQPSHAQDSASSLVQLAGLLSLGGSDGAASQPLAGGAEVPTNAGREAAGGQPALPVKDAGLGLGSGGSAGRAPAVLRPPGPGGQPRPVLPRSVSQPAARGVIGRADSGSPLGLLRGRAQSDQQEAVRMRQAQEELVQGFLQSAAPQSPARPMRAAKRASVDGSPAAQSRQA